MNLMTATADIMFLMTEPGLLLSINRQGVTLLSVLLLVLFFLAFISAGAKVAFFSLRYKDINLLKLKADEDSRRIVRLIEQPKLLSSVLTTAQIIFNLSIVVILNYLIDAFLNFQHAIPVLEVVVKILLISAVILFFAEMLPKVWAHHHNYAFMYFSGWWLESIIIPLCKPSTVWINSITGKIEKSGNKHASNVISEEELDNAIDLMSEEEATLEQKRILKGIQTFSNITVKQVMRSRIDVSGLEWSIPYNAVIRSVNELRYSRLPVYKGNIDEIAGILHTKDLLPHLDEPNNFDWRKLVRPALFVPEHRHIEDVLQEFQQKRIHIAIVIDEFGGTSGIVTMEDIQEEIIGDIKDEFDEEEAISRRMDDYNYVFDGRAMIYEVCKIMNLPADTFDGVKGDSESLAGLVLEIAERLPKENELIESGDFAFTVLELYQNRIQKVKVTIRPN
jgi:gliding motility-associated protein GldE